MLHQTLGRACAELYRLGEVSPVDVARSALEHAERADPIINAFALLDRAARWPRAGSENAGARARRSDRLTACRWPSRNSPPCAAGTRRGSALTSAEPAAAHTVFVQRLADAGAVLLGKTRAPEFNWKGITDSPAFGITRNPWNPSLTPGGSSGCAAAVAAGVVRLSMGSDAGGSIRIPAAFTGTIGLKPTHGRIPCRPCPAPSRTSCTPAPSPPAWTSCGKPIWPRAAPRRWTDLQPGRDGGADAPAARPRIGLLSPRRWGPRSAGARRVGRNAGRAARRRLRRDRSRLRHRGRLAGRPGPVPAGLRGRRAPSRPSSMAGSIPDCWPSCKAWTTGRSRAITRSASSATATPTSWPPCTRGSTCCCCPPCRCAPSRPGATCRRTSRAPTGCPGIPIRPRSTARRFRPCPIRSGRRAPRCRPACNGSRQVPRGPPAGDGPLDGNALSRAHRAGAGVSHARMYPAIQTPRGGAQNVIDMNRAATRAPDGDRK